MSSEEQAAAYLDEAGRTLESARTIYESAVASGENLWAQVVKNGYDASSKPSRQRSPTVRNAFPGGIP